MKQLLRRTKFSALVASIALIGSLGGLSACSTPSNDGGSSSPTQNTTQNAEIGKDSANGPGLSDIKYVEAAKPGDKPTITVPPDLVLTNGTSAILIEGTGFEIEDGDQLTMNYAQFTIPGGEASQGSTWDRGEADNGAVFSPQSIGDEFYKLLSGHKVGTVFAISREVSTDSASADPQFSVLVAKIESVNDLEQRAKGKAVVLPKGLPKVTLAKNGTPSIDIKGFKPSGKMVSKYTIKGNGPKVPQGARVMVHYVGWLADGTQFDSSWARGAPLSFALDEVVKGWGVGLVGKKVGSQVLLVIPPDLAYGNESPSASIPANSTLIFVVDILSIS